MPLKAQGRNDDWSQHSYGLVNTNEKLPLSMILWVQGPPGSLPWCGPSTPAFSFQQTSFNFQPRSFSRAIPSARSIFLSLCLAVSISSWSVLTKCHLWNETFPYPAPVTCMFLFFIQNWGLYVYSAFIYVFVYVWSASPALMKVIGTKTFFFFFCGGGGLGKIHISSF